MDISYLYYNVVGTFAVLIVGTAVSAATRDRSDIAHANQ